MKTLMLPILILTALLTGGFLLISSGEIMMGAFFTLLASIHAIGTLARRIDDKCEQIRREQEEQEHLEDEEIDNLINSIFNNEKEPASEDFMSPAKILEQINKGGNMPNVCSFTPTARWKDKVTMTEIIESLELIKKEGYHCELN